VILVLALLSQVVTAGRLDDFEEKAGEKKSEPKPRKQHESSSIDRPFGSGTYPSVRGGESFLGGFWAWLVASPFDYRHDDPSGRMVADGNAGGEDWAEEDHRLNMHHEPGSPVLPYLRADYNRQYIDSHLDADDVRIEAGYKMLAFHGRHTRYMEHNPSDDLTINQFYGVFRVGGTYPASSPEIHGWELGLGFGAAQQQGNEEHSSGALTIPIKFYPAEWIGIEFRPAWYRPQARTISDYDLSASLGWRYLQLRGGYRWLWLQGQGHYFNGPYAGVSFSF
jgi:hypothetical protein